METVRRLGDGEPSVPAGAAHAASDGVAPRPDLGRATALYVLYLVGVVTGGLTTVVGLILAYVWRGEDPAMDTHCTNAIHVFWKGLLYLLPLYAIFFAAFFGWISRIVALEADGQVTDIETLEMMGGFFAAMSVFVLVSILQTVWFVVRCAKGIGKASSGLPYPNPRAWGF